MIEYIFITAILLCVVYTIGLARKRTKLVELANNYRNMCDYYKKKFENEEKRKWELIHKQPHYEFILGDKTTGWVWLKPIETYRDVSLGTKVKLLKSDTEEVECIVEKCNGIYTVKDYSPLISFNVVECPKNKKIN